MSIDVVADPGYYLEIFADSQVLGEEVPDPLTALVEVLPADTYLELMVLTEVGVVVVPAEEYIEVIEGGGRGIPGSQWYVSSGEPDAEVGVVQDMCLDEASADVWQKTSGGWVLQCNIRGMPGLAGTSVMPFSVGGSLTPMDWPLRLYLERDCQIVAVRVTLGEPSAGAPFVVDLSRNGVSLFPAAKPTLPAGQHTVVAVPTGPYLDQGDYLTVSVVSVGTVATGSFLTVQVVTI